MTTESANLHDPAAFAVWAQAERERRRDDPHRPRYHFLPPANWMNDPNGVIQFGGDYHLFYQYNPFGPLWGAIHWGHAVSTDLVHWIDLPPALAPTPDSPDEAGCWSGCAVERDGALALLYTGVRGDGAREQLICLATSRDGRTFEKYAGNPVIPARPAGLDLVQYRDPTAWREGDGWYLTVGSGISRVGGTALLYRSDDLIHWEYLHPLCTGDLTQKEPIWTGTMWECPDFFPLDGKYVLAPSVWDGHPVYTAYMVGEYAGHRFTPEKMGILDPGRWYAPQSFADDQGRRIMWGWLREGRGTAAQVAAGWSGVMALPRVLLLHPDGDLGQRPAPEVGLLRGEHQRLVDVAVTPDTRDLLPNLRSAQLELELDFDLGDAAACGLVVRRAPDGAEQTRIIYDRMARRLRVDRTRSTLDDACDRGVTEAVLLPPDDGRLHLRVFLDASVVEVFANERACIAERIYPTRADSLGLDLVAEGGAARLRTLDVWQMGT
ncbi:MAG: glycoside hydrolase family 32 protein [Thermomicrobiales bacterium]